MKLRVALTLSVLALTGSVSGAALVACLSSTTTPPSDDAGAMGGSDSAASGGDDGAASALDAGDLCPALLECCPILNADPYTPPTHATDESACVLVATAQLGGTCPAYYQKFAPSGVCNGGIYGIGDASTAPCGPKCTQLATCCPKLAAVDAGAYVAGCTDSATTCTTSSETYCDELTQIITGQITSAFPKVACP